jgi:choice-of-anchor B domain-containing protein
MRSRNITAFAPLLIATLAAPALAQDQLGRAVAVAGHDVLVLKPSLGRGPAAVFVYDVGADGMWRVQHELRSPQSAETGEGLSPSLAVIGETVLVGSGDPHLALGAHTFRRAPDGDWVRGDAIAVPGAPDPGTGPAALDLATLMQIIQPPDRLVATDGEQVLLAVVGGPVEVSGVTVLDRQTASQPWVAAGRLQPSETTSLTDRFGAALAVRGRWAVVGAPEKGNTGAVFVFKRDDTTREWHSQGVLAPPPDDSTVAGFGTALALIGDMLVVGAPARNGIAGQTMVYRRDEATGEWRQESRLMPKDGHAGDRFGAALALTDHELWIGAPGTNQGRGRVVRYTHMPSGAWQSRGPVVVDGLEPGFAFGAAIDVSDGVAVVGAPVADGGRGRAAAFTRVSSDGWSSGQWLTHGRDLPTVSGSEVLCADGQASQFKCNNVDLLSFLPIDAIGGGPGEHVSDLWGWTDPMTGREYALVGRSGGAAFVDITDATMPRYLGVMPGNRSGARDLKVYKDHLFLTGDGAGNHGLLVFNLKRLRDVANPPVTFQPDVKYEGIASAHNLVIDTEAGFAYPVGASGGGQTCGGGLHMVDIRDPEHPTFAGCYTDTEGLIWPGRTHDAQCVVYRGPDQRYQGRQICLASNETALRIVDVTDKTHPMPLSAATYPGLAYVHQGWLTEDQQYFFLDDELDELIGTTGKTRTLIWDVAELDDPVLVGEYDGPDGATDHNLFIKGNRMYQANYQAGFRVIDISNPEKPFEVGYFDTTPYDGNPPGFNGAWTAFPFFASGTVIVSSMSEGLFVLRPRMQPLVP